MSRVFVLGNGESRKDIDIDVLKTKGKVYGCNAIYRDSVVDALSVVDGGMMHEVYNSGYALKNKCYFRSWSKLPEFIYSDMVNLDAYMGWGEGFLTENEKGNKTQFVLNGTDPNQIKRLYDQIIQERTKMGMEIDYDDIRRKLGNHQQWITWVEDEDQVELIPEQFSGWSAGPIAVRMSLLNENPTDVFLIGFDLNSNDLFVNNVYKGTDNYLPEDAKSVPSVNWIKQHRQNFIDYPDVKFWKVNPQPIGSGGINIIIDEWKEFTNLEYICFEDLDLVLDFSFLL